ncbi:Trafficking protein particle complex subunit 2 [Trichoplax sp. H2]|uniref:Trafficking protein particle complex subunit n=1 Tax=Trichoplax adhaerens TaxID=10228 RepID=B3RXI1_TRIAD|nr:hypothetical protein TRIADDRAFT_56217 [Trichoplax adhaerens]EDV24861.1 hypothetical protein TRIADDRAFT_56217 [Trichoplax adhaerens]RDD39474.1 Trafficking protein particle complex subunit 2 [Trichoplax sp. H2]|eukprot:XP_002112751.1 hypothetical protein TRIADDRAFT_56217 [Trichoplax adhaerens]
MTNQYYLAIVGRHDNPLFEIELSATKGGDVIGGSREQNANKREDHKHLNQFIVHSSLDIVDEVMWNTNSMYLKVIDKFNEWLVSALVTAGARFIVLHDAKNEDGIKNFFGEVYELFVKVLMNPFYDIGTPIEMPAFEKKVLNAARKHLFN